MHVFVYECQHVYKAYTYTCWCVRVVVNVSISKYVCKCVHKHSFVTAFKSALLENYFVGNGLSY
jgi:hypothetical protein